MQNLMSDYPEVEQFISNHYLGKMDVGEYELCRNIRVNVEVYTTKLRSEAVFETHKKFVDIQFIIEGQEIITLSDAENMTFEITPYSDSKDVAFYANNLSGIDYVVREGEWLAIEPGQAHMPCICVNGRSIVKKAVFKVPVEIWKK